VVAAALLVLCAAGALLLPKLLRSDLDRLAERDPSGAAACQMLTEWLDGAIDPDTDKPYDRMVAAVAVSDAAAAAKTAQIRAAVGAWAFDDQALALLRSTGQPVENMRFADLAKLHAACVQAGVSMPAYAAPR
jgi:hypothetical protein